MKLLRLFSAWLVLFCVSIPQSDNVALAWTHGIAPPSYYEIWVLIADSNGNKGLAVDGSAGYDAAIDVTNSRIREYRNSHATNSGLNSIVIAQDPLDYNNHTPYIDPTNIAAGSIGPMLPFLRARLAALPSNVGLAVVACSIGGTQVSGWMSGSTETRTTYSRINEAISETAGNYLGGYFTVFGTNEAIGSVSGATITTNYTTLITNHRNSSNVPAASSTTPFIIANLVPAWSSGTSTQIRAAISALPASISKIAVIDMTGVTGQTSPQYHFSAVDDRLIGGTGAINALANLSP